MKRQILTALATIILLVPIGSGAVSYYEKAGYSGGGVVLRMDVPMGTVLSAGEEVGFTFQTLQDAFVVVFNIDSEGYVHLLHPDRGLSRSVARHTYRLPAAGTRLLVRGETGVEFIFAVTVPKRGWIDEPVLFSFVLGQAGALPATARNLVYLVETIPAGSPWCVAGHGGHDLHMSVLSMVMGGHARAGFEDNPYYRPGERATSNAQLIERLVRFGRELGREPATPAEARAMLGLNV